MSRTGVTQHLGVSILFLVMKIADAFMSGPQNQTVPINSTASFSCSPSSMVFGEVTWIIQLPHSNQTLASTQISQEKLLLLGFRTDDNDHTSFVNVSASPANNGTSLRCRAFDDASFTNVFTQWALLSVAGLPLTPGVMMSQPSPLVIILEWGEPFTNQEYPILNYTVIETDLSTGRSNKSIGPTLNHTYSACSISQECRDIQFSVLATSGVGDSEPTVIIGALPKAPDNFSAFLVDVTFHGGGEIYLTVTIKPPEVCRHQEAWLSLKLLRAITTSTISENTTSYSMTTPTLVHVFTGLERDTLYTVVAEVTTEVGNITATRQLITTDSSAYKLVKDLLSLGTCSLLLLWIV